jgi:hypothetical protein
LAETNTLAYCSRGVSDEGEIFDSIDTLTPPTELITNNRLGWTGFLVINGLAYYDGASKTTKKFLIILFLDFLVLNKFEISENPKEIIF